MNLVTKLHTAMCEDLNSDLQDHIKNSQGLWYLPAAITLKRRILEAHGPDRIAKTTNSIFTETPYLK